MKSIFLTAGYFLFFFQVLLAQPGFNIVYDLALAQNHLKEMIVKNDTIIGYGLAQVEDSSGWRQGLLLVKFDSSGNLLQHRILLDSLGDHYGIDEAWGEIINTSDGGYAMTAAAYYRNSAFLIKLTNDFEVEFIKEYPDTVNLSNYNYKILETEDGYFLFGNIQRPNYENNAFAHRVNEVGETIWFKYFGDYNLTSGYNGGARVNDSLYVLVGGRELPSGEGASFVDIINLEGDIIKSWISEPWPATGILRNIIVMSNGEFIINGEHIAETTPFGTDLYNSALSRMDTDFQVQSINYYGIPSTLTAGIRFWDFEPTPDGYFAGAGKGWLPDEQGENAGWLMKFDENGDSLWTQYVIAPFEDPISDWHYLGGVGVLSSGNIVAGGEAREGQQQYLWLVKVTPDGCLDTLWCSPVSVVVEEAEEREALRVWPNPANFSFNLEAKAAVRRVSLLDVTGKEVRGWEFGQPVYGMLHFELPVDLPPGMYFVSLLLEDGSVLGEKMLVR